MLRITYHEKTGSIWCSRRKSIGFRVYRDEVEQLYKFIKNLKSRLKDSGGTSYNTGKGG